MTWNEELFDYMIVAFIATIFWEDSDLKKEVGEYLVPANFERIEEDSKKIFDMEVVLKNKITSKLEPFLLESEIQNSDVEYILDRLEVLSVEAFNLIQKRIIHENQ